MTAPPATCRVCRTPLSGEPLLVREMMFGSRERFPYRDCQACGCLQIESVPADLSRHYPPGYYSYAAQRDPLLKSLLKRRWLAHHRGRPNPIGWAITRLKGAPWFPDSLQGVDPGARILDVGCGTGELLLHLRDAGFRDLTGVDPYIARDLRYRGGVTVWRKPLTEVEGAYDLVMLHHSFEHVDDPQAVLRELARLLAPGGRVLIRTPVARCHAWERYGADWVQIDAPRHLIVHSERSLRFVAGAAGFAVASITYDSTAFQFWGSEQYRRDIPLRDPRSYAVRPGRSPFGAAQIAAWEAEARDLNALGRGDQARFVLVRA